MQRSESLTSGIIVLTLWSPSHHDSACWAVMRENFGKSFAAQSIAAAAMEDGLHSRKLASVNIETIIRNSMSNFSSTKGYLNFRILHYITYICIYLWITLNCREDDFSGPCSEELGVSSRRVDFQREKREITKRGNQTKSPIQDS